MSGDRIEGIQHQEESIDIKAIFLKLARYWYLFALTIFVAVAIAFLFNKYTSPVYEVSASVLVETEKSVDPSAMIGFGGALSSGFEISNEIGKLTSFSLVYRTIKSLDFEVSYFKDESLIKTELYQAAPFEIIFDTAVPQAVGLSYRLTFINNNEFLLEAEGDLIKKYDFSKSEFETEVFDQIAWSRNYRFGDIIQNPYNTFQVVLNEKFNSNEDLNNAYSFVFTDYFSLAQRFRGVEIEPFERESSLLNIKFKTSNVLVLTS